MCLCLWREKELCLWQRMEMYRTAFQVGVATGSASAFSENLATKAEVEAVLKTMISEEAGEQ